MEEEPSVFTIQNANSLLADKQELILLSYSHGIAPSYSIDTCGVNTEYSRLPITTILANSNLALILTKIDFPWITVIYLL